MFQDEWLAIVRLLNPDLLANNQPRTVLPQHPSLKRSAQRVPEPHPDYLSHPPTPQQI